MSTQRQPLFAPSVSLVLDITRFALALAVALGHWSQSPFQHSWAVMDQVGVYCVGGFFVLSGFTIRALSLGSGQTVGGYSLSRYATERSSRILSVTLPALVLTLVLDRAAAWLDPSLYATHWGQTANWPLLRILVNVLPVTQAWGLQVSPLSNSPFWSIGYEAGFYLLWGAWLSWHAGQRPWAGLLVFTLCALFLGPNVMFMLPFWLMGVWMFDGLRCGLMWPRLLALGTLTAAVWCTWVAPGWLSGAIATAFGAIHINPARVTASLVLGCLWAFPVLMLLLAASQQVEVQVSARTASFFRRLGDCTFPLYLFHFPIFVFLSCAGLSPDAPALSLLCYLAVALTVAWAANPAIDRLKLAIRSRAQRMAAASQL